MSKRPNKPVVIVGQGQEMLQFLNTGRCRPVLHGLHFLLVHL